MNRQTEIAHLKKCLSINRAALQSMTMSPESRARIESCIRTDQYRLDSLLGNDYVPTEPLITTA